MGGRWYCYDALLVSLTSGSGAFIGHGWYKRDVRICLQNILISVKQCNVYDWEPVSGHPQTLHKPTQNPSHCLAAR